MNRRRALALLVAVLAVAVPACKAPSNLTAERATTGRVAAAVADGSSLPDPTGSSPTGDATASPGGAARPRSASPPEGGLDATTTSVGGAASPNATATTIGLAGSPTSSTPRAATTTTAVAAPPDNAASAAEATSALDQYLDGLEHENYGSSMNAAADGPRLLAFVRSILKALNENAGASSTFSYTERNYTAKVVTADRVTFAGRAVLHQTTTLKSGEKRQADVAIGDITVTRRGAWVLTDMVWDGSPVQYSAGGDEQKVTNDVKFRLAGAIRFSNATVVIVAVVATKEVQLKIAKDHAIGDGFTNASQSRALVDNYGYFSYPRTQTAPKRWNSDVTVDSDPARHVEMTFS